MFVFRKIWRDLFSWNARFEIHPFALLQSQSLMPSFGRPRLWLPVLYFS